MNTGNMFFGIVAFLMILFIYINEMKNITEFIIKYKSIKDNSRINMEQKCKDIYCEAETDRFQIAKNMYDLLLPNDIYNARTYTTMVMIFSIFLFIYIFYLYFNYLNSIKKNLNILSINDSTIVISILILITFITILVNIIMRYTPYDEKGYINYFMKKTDTKNPRDVDNFHYAIFITLGVGLLIYIITKKYYIKNDNDTVSINLADLFFYSLYFIFAFYFMFTMVNIVEAFKKNDVPDDIYQDYPYGKYENYWTADTAHDSEDFFYSIYFKLIDIPKAIFSSFLDDKQKYNINDIYIFRNLSSIGLGLFLLCIVIGILIFITIFVNEGNKNKIMEYIQMLLPLVFLFFLVFAIVMFTSFNTAFNKYALYGACKSSYTRALNGLNNVVVPFIAMHEKDAGTGSNNLTDYKYNYIVLNVIISYFLNYVNLINNTANVSFLEKKVIYSAIIGKQLKKFQDKVYINDRQIKFNLINSNDTTDVAKFEAYYKELFKEILELEYENGNIPDNLAKEDIDQKYINLLNKIFFNNASKPEPLSDRYIDLSESKDAKIYNKPDLVTKIRNAVYYYINKLDDFNNNIGKYNDTTGTATERDTFLQDFLFYINDDSTMDPYKFVMIEGSITQDITLNTKYDTTYKDEVDKVINVFLTHIRSLYKDIYDSTNGYYFKADNESKVTVFNSQIKTSLKMLSNTQQTETKQISKSRETTDDELKYLFQSFKNFRIKVDAKANYLVNVIETISNELNNTDAKIKLYNVTQPQNLEIDLAEDNKKLSDISGLKIKVVKESDIKDEDILNLANKTTRETFVATYATNIIVLGIVYWLVAASNKGK